jgi:hypothetical protein
MWIATDPDGAVWVYEDEPKWGDEFESWGYLTEEGEMWRAEDFKAMGVDLSGVIPRPDEDPVEIEIVTRVKIDVKRRKGGE